MKSFKEYVEMRDKSLMEYGSESMEWSDVVIKIINDMINMPTKPNVKYFNGFLAKYPSVKTYMTKIADSVVRKEPFASQVEELNTNTKMQIQFTKQVVEDTFKNNKIADGFDKYVNNEIANQPTTMQKMMGTAKDIGAGALAATKAFGRGAVQAGKLAAQTGKEIGHGLAQGISTAGDHISTGVEGVKAAGNAYLNLIDEISDKVAQSDVALTKWGKKMASQNPKYLGWMAK